MSSLLLALYQSAECLIAGPVRAVGDDAAVLHELVQGVVVVVGLWDVGGDVGENLFDAEVAVAEGCAIEETTEYFLSATKEPAPVTFMVDKFFQVACKIRMSWSNSGGGSMSGVALNRNGDWWRK